MIFSRRCSCRWRVVQVGGVEVGSVQGFSFVRRGLSAGQKKQFGLNLRTGLALATFVSLVIIAVHWGSI